jgi:hypothetical protein
MFFKATLDRATNLISAAVALLLLAIPYILTSASNGDIPAPLLLLITLVNIIILGAAYLFSTKGYSVDNQHFIIHKPFSKTKIERNQIESVSQVEPAAVRLSIRLFGSSGLFGYYGLFRNKTLGNYTAYGTQRQNYILLTIKNNKKIIVTPDDPEGLIEALRIQ